jgi:NTE family protein
VGAAVTIHEDSGTSTSGRDRPASVGLVLGAGGLVGQAYHAGALAALEDLAGWDPRSADVVVGSSAGSITGTLLRLGVGASDLRALAAHRPLSPEGAAMVERILPDPSDLPAPPPSDWLRPWRPPSFALLARTVSRPWAFRPGVAAMTLLPTGRIDIAERARPLDEMVGEIWPSDLWICAARRTDGARVVFGRPGSPRSSLAAAVLASCAIPAYFAPVTINGVEYFDGGVHSSTNADVLRHRAPDVVVVVAPMSTVRPPLGSADGFLRWSSHRRLDREMRRLERAGSTVVRIEPSSTSLGSMGLRPMDDDRSRRVADAGYQDVTDLWKEGLLPRRLAQPVVAPARRAG